MKKIITLLIISLAIIGCSQKPQEEVNAKAIYLEASKSFSESKSVDMKMTMVMDVEGNEESEEMGEIVLDMKLIHNDDPTKIKAAMKMSMGELAFSYYLDQGYFYMDAFGYKMKQVMDDEALATFNVNDTSSTILGDNALLDKLTYKKDGDNSVFTLELNSHEEIMTALQSVDNESIGDLTEEDVQFEKLSLEMVVDKDSKLIKYIMKTTAVEKELNEKANIEVTILVNAYGDKVVVDLPDFSEYTEQ